MKNNLKSAIKKAINDNHKKYSAIKLWDIEITHDSLDESLATMRIELTVRKRKKTLR